MKADLDRAVKAIDQWQALLSPSRLDFHAHRAEQKMLEACLNFVVKHNSGVSKMIAALAKANGEGV